MEHDKNKNQDVNRPNQASNKDKAEGSRETVRGNEPGRDRDQQGGISNRPLDREQSEQEEMPPRGKTKDEDRNA